MNQIKSYIALLILILAFPIFCQNLNDTEIVDSDINQNPEVELDDNEKEKSESGAGNANIDMQVIYGQYNTMNSIINLSQDHENFVFLLNSDFKMSNDYGYNGELYDNSSYYKNKIEFTGNINFTETWKSINEVYIDNDSKGMLENRSYTNEDKDKFYFKSKNVKRISTNVEAYFTGAYSYYNHNLLGGDLENSKTSNVSNIFGSTGGEIIWSSSNRLKMHIDASRYFYHNYSDDYYFSGQIVDDFNITKYIGVSFGIVGDYNRDLGLLGYENDNYPYKIPVIPILFNVTLRGMKYTSFSVQYKGQIESFKPEEFYFEQDFIDPQYDLPPSRVHNMDYKLDFNSSRLSVKVKGFLKYYDNYHTYQPSNELVTDKGGNLLKAFYFPAAITHHDISSEYMIVKDMLFLIAGYEYFRSFDTDYNIIYSPEHIGSVALKIDTDYGNIEWKNNYTGGVYTDIDTDKKMDDSIYSELDLQIKTIESLYIYIKCENLYNSKYYIRDGYPMAGFSILAGLRSII